VLSIFSRQPFEFILQDAPSRDRVAAASKRALPLH
jgi:hypothetical protein